MKHGQAGVDQDRHAHVHADRCGVVVVERGGWRCAPRARGPAASGNGADAAHERPRGSRGACRCSPVKPSRKEPCQPRDHEASRRAGTPGSSSFLTLQDRAHRGAQRHRPRSRRTTPHGRREVGHVDPDRPAVRVHGALGQRRGRSDPRLLGRPTWAPNRGYHALLRLPQLSSSSRCCCWSWRPTIVLLIVGWAFVGAGLVPAHSFWYRRNDGCTAAGTERRS